VTSSGSRGRVAVVGGGVVGLCLAEALERRGAEVLVLEAGACGGGSSAGNAGWVTPALASPLPEPGMTLRALRWTLDPRGPLTLRPTLRPSFLRWLFDFWRSTSRRRYRHGVAAMAAFSKRATADVAALAERGVEFELHRQGVMFVSRRRAAIESELHTLEGLREHGYEGEVEILDAAAAREREPALRDGVAGAVIAPAESHVRPEKLTSSLVARLHERGVELRERTPVRSLAPVPGGWTLECEGGDVAAAKVVLANGVGVARLLAPLGVRLPLQGAKGYSLTVEEPRLRLRGPVYLMDAKVAVSPYAGALRLAGILELGTDGTAIRRRRIAAIERAAAQSFREWSAEPRGSAWAGVRSLLPDGLPAIGPVRGHDGLHVASGHAMLGMTLAPSTAEALAPVVLDGPVPKELLPFSIDRFDNRGRRPARTPVEERP